MYVMVDFICMGFLKLQVAEARFIKWKIFSAHSGIWTRDPLDLEANAVTIRPWGLHTISLLKLNQIFLALTMSSSWHVAGCLSCIQYCSHTTSVLFCSLTNNHTSILVHGLNNPVFLLPLLICRWQRLLKNRVTSLTLYRISCIWSRWDYVDFTHRLCNHSTITTLFQTYLLTLGQINFKNDLFHYFSALKITTWNPGYSVSLSGEINTIRSIIFFILY